MRALPPIGLVGYGRFGAAFGDLLDRHGIGWCGWDAHAEVPAHRAAGDLDDLVARSGLLLLAVPVAAIDEVLEQLRPRLGVQHQVLDVGSVKEKPCRAMDAILGDAVGHAGCHPLFGPLSIARGEPLRTVICPSPRHPATAGLAASLFEAIGSAVVLQDPAEHDRRMARTHAMAFFIARGLIELGIDDDEIRWAPASFAALAASIAAVRADAGHLFDAIQNENPYAAGTRRRLVEALADIDRRLAESATIAIDPAEPA